MGAGRESDAASTPADDLSGEAPPAPPPFIPSAQDFPETPISYPQVSRGIDMPPPPPPLQAYETSQPWWSKVFGTQKNSYTTVPTGYGVGVASSASSSYTVTATAIGDQPPVMMYRELPPRLPCCGLGVGLTLFILGFPFPLLWIVGVFVYFCAPSVYSDQREHVGLLACCVAALIVILSGGFFSFIFHLHGSWQHYSHGAGDFSVRLS